MIAFLLLPRARKEKEGKGERLGGHSKMLLGGQARVFSPFPQGLVLELEIQFINKTLGPFLLTSISIRIKKWMREVERFSLLHYYLKKREEEGKERKVSAHKEISFGPTFPFPFSSSLSFFKEGKKREAQSRTAFPHQLEI